MQPTIPGTVSIRTIFLSSLLCVLATFSGCNNPHPKKDIEANVQALANDETEWLKGKSLCSADSIIGKTEGEKRILYIFNFYDCPSCINNGFAAVQQIDSIAGDGTVKAIASMFQEVSSTQRQTCYKGYIYIDTKDRIRKELKYAPTPMLLILDDSCRIEDAFLFDTSSGKEKRLEAFIKNCFSLSKHS
ncbi:MAG TPA: hypothetical protein H9785_07720 [Candidatus Bacteroides intestinavium]|uniref:Uncharacterized protein n=1 Tax=Candidatus Bacteroides intestinavium TaxID=2838469 RepID=A0A9D2KT16_9BACE|nr:hypothetical protein [Candidatus Bacteroides intestinavium]